MPHSVKINPGLIALTRTFGAAITANDFIKWIDAAFVTMYANEDPPGFTPAMLAVVMKLPSVFSSSALAA